MAESHQDQECQSAVEFLDALQPYRAPWHPPEASRKWIFRGQGDSDWPLLPRLLREQSDQTSPQDPESLRERVRQIVDEMTPIEVNQDTERKRALKTEACLRQFAEVLAIGEFCDLADELGFPIKQANRRFAVDERAIRNALNDRLWDVMSERIALAQHHGITTRLLDWTRRPLVAGYFAARQARDELRKGRQVNRLAVWAMQYIDPIPPEARLQVFTCPRHQMTYLHAQDAVFTWDRNMVDAYNGANGRWVGHDEAIRGGSGDDAKLRLCRVTLPAEKAPELLVCLWAMRISIAHLMPTLDNVAAAVRDRVVVQSGDTANRRN